jgi:hypothetical protein
VDICSDSSVLVTSFFANNVRRLTINGAGALTDTGDVLPLLTSPDNVSCAPNAKSGVVLTSNGVTSFTIPGLPLVDTRPLSAPNTVSAALNPAGNRVFARVFTPDFVDTFAFNSTTGGLGAAPLFRIPVARPSGFFVPFGIDQVVVHPNGAKLYVSEPGDFGQPSALNVYDTNTGTLLRSITDSHIVQPTGVCFPAPFPTVDHYKCYEAKGHAPRETVNLEDQFGKELGVQVGTPAFFCNPVNKNGEGILNPEVHLTCYEIKSDDGRKRDVVVENQFGDQTLTVDKPKLLCVPSGKTAVVPHKD